MRFSLSTLLLFVFWIGLGMTVWACRKPWRLHSEEPLAPDFVEPHNRVAPDQRREVSQRFGWGPGDVVILDGPRGQELAETPFSREDKNLLFEIEDMPSVCSRWFASFLDDDTVVFYRCDPPKMVAREANWEIRVTFKRRFPEWWWGHFFRVEVWLFALTGFALLLRGIRSIRERKRRVSALGTGRGICPGSSSSLAGTPA